MTDTNFETLHHHLTITTHGDSKEYVMDPTGVQAVESLITNSGPQLGQNLYTLLWQRNEARKTGKLYDRGSFYKGMSTEQRALDVIRGLEGAGRDDLVVQILSTGFLADLIRKNDDTWNSLHYDINPDNSFVANSVNIASILDLEFLDMAGVFIEFIKKCSIADQDRILTGPDNAKVLISMRHDQQLRDLINARSSADKEPLVSALKQMRGTKKVTQVPKNTRARRPHDILTGVVGAWRLFCGAPTEPSPVQAAAAPTASDLAAAVQAKATPSVSQPAA